MRVYFKTLISFFSVFALLTLNSSIAIVYAYRTFDDESAYLIVGVDEAGQNTDAIMLLKFDRSENVLSVVHIPRDCYVRKDGVPSKINGIFAHSKASGKTSAQALSNLSNFIEENFSVKISGSFLVVKNLIVELVDLLSGVDINLDNDLKITDSSGNTRLHLKKGLNHLTGDEAYVFLRHRKSYPNGDIGRIGAHDTFIYALLDKLRKTSDFRTVYKIYSLYSEYAVDDLKFGEIFRILIASGEDLKNSKVKFYTLPGREMRYNGISYYFVNIPDTNLMLKSVFCSVKGISNDSIFIP